MEYWSREKRWGQLAEQSSDVSSSSVCLLRSLRSTRSVSWVSRWQLMRLRRAILPIFSALSNGSSISANMSSAEVDNWDLCLRHFVTSLEGIRQSSVQLCFTSKSIISKYIINVQLHFKYQSEVFHSSILNQIFLPWQSLTVVTRPTFLLLPLKIAWRQRNGIKNISLAEFIKIFQLFSVQLNWRSSETKISKNLTGWLVLHLIDITLELQLFIM